MKKYLLNKPLLLVCLLLLLLVNIFLTYILLFSSPVTIVNKSDNYHLEYRQSAAFLQFLNTVRQTGNPKTSHPIRINKIKITVIDRDAPDSPPPIGTIPITITYDTPPENSSQINIHLGIDKKDEEKTRANININDMVSIMIVRSLYIRSNPTISITNREPAIQKYTQTILKNGSPFIVTHL